MRHEKCGLNLALARVGYDPGAPHRTLMVFDFERNVKSSRDYMRVGDLAEDGVAHSGDAKDGHERSLTTVSWRATRGGWSKPVRPKVELGDYTEYPFTPEIDAVDDEGIDQVGGDETCAIG